MIRYLLFLLLPLTLFGQSQKISDMTSATALTGSEYVPIVQTTNKKSTVTLLRGWASTIGTAGQLLKVNAGATALEFFTPSYLSTYPGAGIPLSTGSAWGTSITDNSSNWNTAYGWGDHASAGYLTSLTVGTSTITSGTNTKVLYNNSGVLGEYTVSGSGNVALTTSPVFTTPNIGTATGTASGNYSLATGGTLTGVNTITSNVNSGINFAGTWTATATSQSNLNFGGTFTAFGGSPNILYGYRFNPTLIGSGTGGTQVGVQINPSFSGGTSPNNIYLQVGNITPIASYGFQAYTGYFSGALRFDANLNDNRDNNIIQQSSSATASNRTMTIGNPTYSTVDFVHAGALRSNQSAVNTGVAPNAFKVIGGAHTNLTLSNPVVDVYFNIGRTVQSAAGTIANNRYVYIENPTHSFVGASTSSREVTVAIHGAPTAGTNATFTNSIGLEVESGAVGSGTATSYAAYFNAQTGATNNYGIGVTGGINFTGALMPSGSAGTSGYFLQSAGAGATPVWTDQTIQTVKVTLSSAEVLALNSSPKVLIAAPGAGKVIQIINAYLYLDYNSTTYLVATDLNISCNGYVLGTSSGFLTNTSDGFGSITPNSANTNTDQVNKSLDLTTSVDPTTGNSPVYVYVTYRIITL